MFTTTTLFKGITCPEGSQCNLLNCMFRHEIVAKIERLESLPSLHDSTAERHYSEDSIEIQDERPVKRQRIHYDHAQDKPPSRADLIRAQIAEKRNAKWQANGIHSGSKTAAQEKSIATLQKAVSPPPPSPKLPKTAHDEDSSPWTKLKESSKSTPETLNPRLLKPAPDSHAKRVVYVQHMHGSITKLNTQVRTATKAVDDMDPNVIRGFVLSNAEIITFVLDEEEVVARTKGLMYPNAIRSVVAAYAKMTLSSWLAKLKIMQRSSRGGATQGSTKAVAACDTGLPHGLEHLILPHLTIRDQGSLKGHGYTISPPSEAEIAEVMAAIELSRNFEECDRCGNRFRIVHGRDTHTGHLTTGGPCKYHWARKSFQTRQKTDAYTGNNEPMYPCCGQALGTEGCTEHVDHVYKSSSSNRLAAVMQFVTTPENANPKRDRKGHQVEGVVFDCEMGYTTNGLELIRLTAISWPQAELLVDVLVRPLGVIIDLNTRFSGVSPEHMAKAMKFADDDNMIPGEDGPFIVEYPAHARQLLCNFLTPATPLMGHAIDNDLNTTRLCHPTIVDTVLLFSHPRGLPYRFGLKMLTKKYLARSIQSGGAAGHDSLEDSIATADLVKVKAAEVWKELQSRGWCLDGRQLKAPAGDLSAVGWFLSTKKRKAAQPQGNGLGEALRRIEQEAVSAEDKSMLTV